MTTADAPTSAGLACDYCGLPLTARVWSWRRSSSRSSPSPAPSEPHFCCYGCRLAAQITGERGAQGIAQSTLLRIGLSVFLSLNVMMFTMALWSQDIYAAGESGAVPLAATLADLLRYLCLVLSLPVLFLLGIPLWEHAWSRGWRGLASTDALILLGVAAAFAYSVVSVWRGAGHVYFEVGCTVLVMVTLGRWLEATGKLQATAGLEALERLLPNEVRCVSTAGEQVISLADLQVGERIRILAGERVPVDGTIVRGRAALDTHLLTGESEPRDGQPGTQVAAGYRNLDGELLVEATAPPGAGALARLVQLVREARQTKGKYQRLAEQVASYFLPAVLAIALATFGWHTWHAGGERGLLAGLAVLLIACPCALGLATPMAVSAAMGSAARAQVLIQHGEALERLASIRAIRFDKTGTLTDAAPRVARVIVAGSATLEEVQRRLAPLAEASSHLYAQAIARWCPSATSPPSQLQEVCAHAGRGVSGHAGDSTSTTYLGSSAWMQELGVRVPSELADALDVAHAAGESCSLVSWEGSARALIVLSEALRPGAAEALAACRRLGLDVAILTGDHQPRGAALGATLGCPVLAEQLPEDKLQAIRQAQAEFGAVAMVGDGVNDAPALAAADLGIALGCGADLSRESAQICLLGNDPQRVAWSVELAQRTVRVIRWNLVWAFGYNAVGVGLAATGWLNPAWAALAMVASSAMVIANCLRLQRGDVASCDDATPVATERAALAPLAVLDPTIDAAPLAASR